MEVVITNNLKLAFLKNGRKMIVNGNTAWDSLQHFWSDYARHSGYIPPFTEFIEAHQKHFKTNHDKHS